MREQHEDEMDLLREKAMQQERQLQDVSRQAADILTQQDNMRQDLLLEMDARGVGQRNVDLSELKDALEELREEFEMFDEEEGAVSMKSWIEQ